MNRLQVPVFLILISITPVSFAQERFITPPGVVTENAARAPLGKYFLLRRGEDYAAIKLIEITKTGTGGVTYVWHAQSDGSGLFTHASTKGGFGEVFENYRHVSDNEGPLETIQKSMLYIDCGPIKVEWSRGNWIYLNTPAGALEAAFTEAASIDQINYLDPNLKWRKLKQKAGKGDTRTKEEQARDEFDDLIEAYDKQLHQALTRLYSAESQQDRNRAEFDVRKQEHILKTLRERREKALKEASENDD